MECCLPNLVADSSKPEKVQSGLFSATKPGSLSSVSACWGRTSVPAQQQGPRWYQQEYGGTCGPLLHKVNPSPNTHRSKVLEINVNIGVDTICQNEISQLCRWLHFAVKEDRPHQRPLPLRSLPASCLPNAVAWQRRGGKQPSLCRRRRLE